MAGPSTSEATWACRQAGHRTVALPRGRRLRVRPVTPDDVDGLSALYSALSDDDRYRRFFSLYHPSRQTWRNGRAKTATTGGGSSPPGAQRVDGGTAPDVVVATLRKLSERGED